MKGYWVSVRPNKTHQESTCLTKRKSTHIKSYSINIVFWKETNTTYTTHILHSFTGPANPRCYCRRHHWASVRSSALSSSWELYLGVVRLQPWAMASIANGIKLLAGWWLTYHLEKYEFVSWNDYPIFFVAKRKMFQITNQLVITGGYFFTQLPPGTYLGC